MKRAGIARLAAYAAAFLVLTALFLVLNIPTERLAAAVNRRAEAMAPGLVTVQGASLRLPATLALRGVTLRLRGRDIDLGAVDLRPVLATMFGKDKRVRGTVAGPLGGGDFVLLLQKEARGIELEGLRIDLSAFPGVGDLPVTLAGTVQAKGRASFIPEGGGRIVGEGVFDSEEVLLAGGILQAVGAGEIRLAPVEVNWKAADNLVTLGQAEIGGDLIGNARGTVRLVPSDLGSSRLDIVASLRPSAEAKDRLGSVLVLAGAGERGDAGVTLRLRGTVAQPALSF